jgi:hypothetical protein
MDDVMILMHQSILDVITGFDETDFGIFSDEDQPIIIDLWAKTKGDFSTFMRYLSPEQKICIAHWMSHRITYPKENLIIALENFLKYLKSYSYKKYSTYPKYKDPYRKKNTDSDQNRKKKFFLP